jgi:tetratricopeptide (TPR) repeat protein
LGGAWSVGAAAQTGAVKGKVVDQSGAPVEKVEVVVDYQGGVSRRLTTVSNDRGDFIQVGLSPGEYRLTFQKEGYEPATHDLRVGLGSPTEVGQVVLARIPEGGISRAEAAKRAEALTADFAVGVEASRKGDHLAAAAAFEKVLEVNPNTAGAHFNLGYTYEKLNQQEKAIDHYRKAIEQQSDYFEAYTALATIHDGRKDYAEALRALAKARELRPEDPVSLYNYGAIAMNSGDIAGAEEAFQKLVGLDPSHAAATFQLGMVYVNQAKNDDAVRLLEKYLALEPEGANAPTARGVIEYLKK